MSLLQTLPPDQRAVLQLLLQKDRSYHEIADLLRLDAATVSGRAHAAVAALGPDAPALSDAQRGELTDFLLGEQTASSRAATRAFLEGSPAARAWARAAADELRPLGGDRLPEIATDPPGTEAAALAAPVAAPQPPAGVAAVTPAASVDTPEEAHTDLPAAAMAEPAAPEPGFGADVPVHEGPTVTTSGKRSSSRIGGMLLVFGIAAAIAVVIILALRGFAGDDEPDNPVASTPAPAAAPAGETPAPTNPSTTGTTAAAPSVNAEIQLRPPSGQGDARATATLITQSGRESIAIAGQNLPPTTERAFYGLWFANSTEDALFLGYAPQVGENGRMRLFDSLPKTADPSQYKEIWITREVVTQDTTTPTTPGTIALSGPLER